MRKKQFIMPSLLLLAICTLVAWASSGAEATISTPLTVYSANHHYLTNNGTPVVILGVGQPLPGRKSADYRTEIDGVAAHKGNYVRLWTLPVWESTNVYMPWARDGGGTAKDGQGKYNLTHWDSNFWNQLKAAIAYAQSKDIYVDVMLFDECGMESGTGRWVNHPFNPSNNVNGLSLSTSVGVPGFYDLNNSNLMNLQRLYVDKLLQETSGYPNVIYEICNEYSQAWAWEGYWLNYVNSRVSNMISVNRVTGAPAEYWTAAGIDMVKFHWVTTSPGTTNGNMNSYYSKNIAINYDETPETTGISSQNYRNMSWAAFVGGGHIHLENGENPSAALDAINYLRNFIQTNDVHFWEMSPNNSLVTGTPGGSAYTLAKPGSEYVVYITGSGSGNLKINLTSGYTYTAKAYNPSTGAYTNLSVSGNTISGIPSYSQDMVVYIKLSGQASASSPAITLGISSNKTSAVPGDTVTYTVSYKNSGAGGASNVTISAPVPGSVSYVSGGTYDSTARAIKWNVAAVAAGASGTLTYSVKVN